LAARFAASEIRDRRMTAPPSTTALGALLAHITVNADAGSFQPMNVNFGLMPDMPRGAPPVNAEGKKLRGKARMAARKENRQRGFTSRARADFADWMRDYNIAAE